MSIPKTSEFCNGSTWVTWFAILLHRVQCEFVGCWYRLPKCRLTLILPVNTVEIIILHWAMIERAVQPELIWRTIRFSWNWMIIPSFPEEFQVSIDSWLEYIMQNFFCRCSNRHIFLSLLEDQMKSIYSKDLQLSCCCKASSYTVTLHFVLHTWLFWGGRFVSTRLLTFSDIVNK